MSWELILWLLLAFFIGCILGYLLRWLLAPEPVPVAKPTTTTGAATSTTATAQTLRAPETAAKPMPAAAPAPSKPRLVEPRAAAEKPAAKPKSASKPKAAAAAKSRPKKARVTGKPKRPRGLAAARGGKPDNLQQISGVGPKLEKTLQGLGFFHFSQIAAWNGDEVKWVDEHLRFKGRIERDKWIPQAKLLAAGDMDKYAKQFGSGGQTKSGSGARKTK